jgi:2'-5' RNA ligase
MTYANVSFWLLPAEADRVFYQETIRALAQAYDAPVFTPHVTLYSGTCPPEADPEDMLTQATQGVQGFSLHIDRILYTEEFTKTVFVQLLPSTLLRSIAENLSKRCAPPSGYVLNPHVSLIYKQMSAKEKQQIATTIRLPASTVFFDEVSAVATSNTTQTREDVESWKVICSKKLLA